LIGKLAQAMVQWGMAKQLLGYAAGCFLGVLDRSAGLWPACRRFGDRLEAATRGHTPAFAPDVVDFVTDALLVFKRRDGLDISYQQALERARNIVMGLNDRWELVERPADPAPELPAAVVDADIVEVPR
jgi:hypothetical protein